MPAVSASPDTCELAIVGAGTAGAAAALFAAEHGLKVVCLERGLLDRAGANWLNGVPRWVFDAVGLEPPQAPELVGGGRPYHLVAGYDGPRVIVEQHEVLELDMRHLRARLQARAQAAGAVFVGQTRVDGVEGRRLIHTGGSLRFDWLVDASGLAGLDLLASPALDRRDLCTAAQEVRRCDEVGARAFFARHEVAYGDTLCFSGVAGGYSILNLVGHGDRVSLLTGTIPADAGISGQRLLADFVAEQPWIGEREFGGARAIPVRRSHDRLAQGRIAAIGDAACQIFPAHGSGIAPQLLAARVLAEQLAAGHGVHGYAVEFQRRYGGLLAGYDVFRRFSQDLEQAELAQLMRSGIMSPSSTRAALEQRTPGLPGAGELLDLGRGLVRAPALAARLSKVAARMVRLRALYAGYPRSAALLPRWRALVERELS
jgi:flavin-dependent dehydrogenase